jgi:hypothetical protein
MNCYGRRTLPLNHLYPPIQAPPSTQKYQHGQKNSNMTIVYNIVSEQLDKIYKVAMVLAWQQIDVAEMKTVAIQAKKAYKKGN